MTPYPDYDRRPQVEAPKVWTADEVVWACFFTGIASMLLTCGMALLWGTFS